jgi:serine/threonine protein kinase
VDCDEDLGAQCALAKAIEGDGTLNSRKQAMIGRTLSHYQILEKIGSGGMGEVYRSLDTKLGREVAIKILPEAFARNPDRVARLRREAQVLAALNHPNVAAVLRSGRVRGAASW